MRLEPSFPDLEIPAVTQAELNAFSEAAADPNPIHLDPRAAERAGLPGVIAHGMWVASRLTARAQALAGPAVRLERMHYRFKGMTLLGDRLTLRASAREEGRTLQMDLQALKADGAVVCQAQAFFERI